MSDDLVAAGAVTNVAPFLKGVEYPARRERIVEHARAQGADASAIDELRKLPADREFANPLEVFDAIGDEVRGL